VNKDMHGFESHSPHQIFLYKEYLVGGYFSGRKVLSVKNTKEILEKKGNKYSQKILISGGRKGYSCTPTFYLKGEQ